LNDKTRFAAINLKLKRGEKSREIAIGYGYVIDSDKLNAARSINKDDFDFSRYNNIYDLIKGRCAGVQIINNRDIIIRGVNSVSTKEASALVLVDGVPYNKDNLRSIQPAMVKSINVIKDSGTAIYGTRGANGVILIETKRGGDK
jgi:TonB-dependent SusC/RagA subfamily outer membrane receptor